MGRSQQSYIKREKEKKRLKKREEKQKKKEARKAEAKEKDEGIPFAYVDKYGRLSDTPVEPNKEDEEIVASDIVLGIPKKEKSADDDAVKRGRVAFFDHKKGFGFITDSTTQEKYFCHVSGLKDEISEGDTVTFDLERGQKGFNAINVVLVTQS